MGLEAPKDIKRCRLVEEKLVSTKSWDKERMGTLLDDWIKFKNILPQLDNVTIPRIIGIWKPTMIHAFGDSSEIAYGTSA